MRHTDRTYRILPTYTGDVSGACSALFELGGMVVIHDPSGCNSTYNTHDETRWYDHDSLIFITGFTEREAVLGTDDKLVTDVVDAVRELRPRFVALCNSPIPFISGMDFRAIAKKIERICSIPCFYVRTNGMHDYVVGAQNAFTAFAERFVSEGAVRRGTANILGVTPLDFHRAGAARELRDFCEGAGFEVVGCWTMGSSFEEILHAAEAQVNLVVSATGLTLAERLRERFGTPYVVGTPTGTFSESLAEALREAAATNECAWPCRDLRTKEPDGTHVIIGEPVAAASEAAAAELAGAAPLRLVCPLEVTRNLAGPHDVWATGEHEIEEGCRLARVVLADPFYQEVLAPGTCLEPRPHLAFSGRNALGPTKSE